MPTVSRIQRRVQFAFLALKLFYENQSALRRFLIKSGASVALVIILLKLAKKLKRLWRILSGKGGRQNKGRRGEGNQLALATTAETAVKKRGIVNPSLNRQFFVELVYLLKLMFPRWFSKQAILLSMHTLTLVCRTFLSIYVAKLEGLLVRNIVEKNFRLFWLRLVQWLLIAVPATTCNSLIRYLESKLDLELKSQLIRR